MITIIDYGLGNVRSIYAKIEQMNEPVTISSDIGAIESADKIILPGVGAFDSGMENIRKLGIREILDNKVIRDKIPILGICLGMQLMTRKSEEGTLPGLGYVDADTKKFRFDAKTGLNIPHMGWNTITINKESPLLNGIVNNSRFYFVHSYHVTCDHSENTMASTLYGYEFASIIQQENIFGVQFHPEKSHKQGIQLIKNFVRM
jgi:imidazole glycerol-phosphate synthase subunit HisH